MLTATEPPKEIGDMRPVSLALAIRGLFLAGSNLGEPRKGLICRFLREMPPLG